MSSVRGGGATPGHFRPGPHRGSATSDRLIAQLDEFRPLREWTVDESSIRASYEAEGKYYAVRLDHIWRHEPAWLLTVFRARSPLEQLAGVGRRPEDRFVWRLRLTRAEVSGCVERSFERGGFEEIQKLAEAVLSESYRDLPPRHVVDLSGFLLDYLAMCPAQFPPDLGPGDYPETKP